MPPALSWTKSDWYISGTGIEPFMSSFSQILTSECQSQLLQNNMPLPRQFDIRFEFAPDLLSSAPQVKSAVALRPKRHILPHLGCSILVLEFDHPSSYRFFDQPGSCSAILEIQDRIALESSYWSWNCAARSAGMRANNKPWSDHFCPFAIAAGAQTELPGLSLRLLQPLAPEVDRPQLKNPQPASALPMSFLLSLGLKSCTSSSSRMILTEFVRMPSTSQTSLRHDIIWMYLNLCSRS